MNRKNRKNRMNRRFSLVALALAAGAPAALAQSQGVDPDSAMMLHLVQDPQSVGLLQIVTNNEQQEIEIIVGPAEGEVRVFGVDGISSDFVFTGITEIDVTTGSNQDFLRVRFFTPICPDLSIDTGAGLSDVIVRYDLTGTAPATTNVLVTGGTTHDKVDFQVESLASSFTADWNVQHGAGNNESKASINSPEDTQRLDVALITVTGAGLDIYDVNVISAASTMLLDLRNNAGGGLDGAYVQVQELRSASTTVRFAQNLGAGDDIFDSTIIKVGGTGRINGSVAGAAGNDNLKLTFEGNGVVNATLNGGAGNDYLDFFAKGRITGTPRLLGGDGNDFLKFVVDGPRVATPFLDGGAGFDEAIGWGTIVNVEVIH